jgi:hypothetical protein
VPLSPHFFYHRPRPLWRRIGAATAGMLPVNQGVTETWSD